MSFADLIKKGSLRQFATATVATVATAKPPTPSSVASVSTVSVATAQKQAANDPMQAVGLVANPTLVNKETRVSSGTVSTPVSSTAAAMPDPDRWCWPHSSAMTGREIDTMVERTSLFNRRGLVALEAELLADKLVNRDREADDRRLCLECVHLAGNVTGAWGCRNWQQAEVATQARDAQLSPTLVRLLQRCNGVKGTQP